MNARDRSLRVTVVGPSVGEDALAALEGALPSAGLVGARLQVPGSGPTRSLVVAPTLPEPLEDTARERLLAWLRVRTGFPEVQLVVTLAEARRR